MKKAMRTIRQEVAHLRQAIQELRSQLQSYGEETRHTVQAVVQATNESLKKAKAERNILQDALDAARVRVSNAKQLSLQMKG